MNNLLILVVEDDRHIRNFICVSLKSNGYECIETASGNDAVNLVASHSPDIILLDLGLPDIDGLDVIERIRQWSTVPIIVVSARGQEHEKVQALDLGADDYLTKPFGVDELSARIRVMLRNRIKNETPAVFKAGDLTVDYAKRLVTICDKEIYLTPAEYKILCLFTKTPGKVLTYNFIHKEVWGTEGYDSQHLRVFMASLRRKIEKTTMNPQYIKTIVGVGYRFNDIQKEDCCDE